MNPLASVSLGAGVAPGTPAASQAATPERQAALAFERQLVLQLTKQLAETAKSTDEDATSAADNAYLDMLPGTLADAVVQGGGLGLADQLAPVLGEEPR